jgi:hypothetical protein
MVEISLLGFSKHECWVRSHKDKQPAQLEGLAGLDPVRAQDSCAPNAQALTPRGHRQHHFAELRTRLEVSMRGRSFRQRKNAIHDGLEPARGH